jgi:hypothetical protein
MQDPLLHYGEDNILYIENTFYITKGGMLRAVSCRIQNFFHIENKVQHILYQYARGTADKPLATPKSASRSAPLHSVSLVLSLVFRVFGLVFGLVSSASRAAAFCVHSVNALVSKHLPATHAGCAQRLRQHPHLPCKLRPRHLFVLRVYVCVCVCANACCVPTDPPLPHRPGCLPLLLAAWPPLEFLPPQWSLSPPRCLSLSLSLTRSLSRSLAHSLTRARARTLSLSLSLSL